MKRFLILTLVFLSVIAIGQIGNIHFWVCKHMYSYKYNEFRIKNNIEPLPMGWSGQFIDDGYIAYRTDSLKRRHDTYYEKDIQFAYFFKMVKETDYYQGQIESKPAFIKKIYFYGSGSTYYRLFTCTETIPDIVYDGGKFVPQEHADSLINSWSSSKVEFTR